MCVWGGQARAGRVVRLIMEETVEERILQWQTAKADAPDDSHDGPLPLAALVRLLD